MTYQNGNDAKRINNKTFVLKRNGSESVQGNEAPQKLPDLGQMQRNSIAKRIVGTI